MIIAKLGGGLGNQMFQYALGRKLSIKNNDEFFLDTTTFVTNTSDPHYRSYGLLHFNINTPFATSDQINKLKFPYGKLFSKINNRIQRTFLNRQHIKFEPYILKKKGNIYIDGFWQSEKYFKDIRNIILKDFSLKNPLSTKAQEIEKNIFNSKNSVSLHVRRGDFVESDHNIQVYGNHCNQEYYSKSLTLIEEGVGALSVFVFSDNIEWVKNNINISHSAVYIEENSAPDYERMILMSKCEHHIIANSTFGWWGAWLNDKAGKIVVTPSVWIPGIDLPIDDIIPENWTKMITNK